MAQIKKKTSPYAHAHEEAKAARIAVDTPQTRNSLTLLKQPRRPGRY
ncbi:MAG: hypothetical protein ABIJ59_11395 [Pseudomonadota bacterium]